MWSLLRSVRYLPRYRRIVAVLSRHGLGWLADQVGLTRFLTWPRRLFRRDRSVQPLPSLAQRLCRSLEELGPTYVLLGHYLSTRVDLLPGELCRDLVCLPACAPAMPPDEIVQVLEEELGRAWAELFVEFDSEPWHCTWLEQVHRARLPSGREVFVAVPNVLVRSQWEQDRPVLQELARLVDERGLGGHWWQASDLVNEFTGALRQELDARERGRNNERWRQNFAQRDQPVFPEVDWERTTARVLICQALPGQPLDRFVAARPEKATESTLALYRFFVQAMFEDGFYPVPPSLGRLAVLEDGRLAATICAPGQYLDSVLRQGIARLLRHFQHEDIDEIITEAVSLGLLERRRVSAVVHQAVRHLIERYHGIPLSEVCLHELAGDLFALASRGIITLPGELSLLLRTLVAVENWGCRLDPQVSLAGEAAALLQRVLAAQHSWRAREERLLRGAQAWLDAFSTFPRTFQRLLLQAKEGDLVVGVEPRDWQKPMRRLKRMVHRLVLSVIAAGLLIALTIISTALFPEAWQPWRWIPAGLALLTLSGLGFFLWLTFLRRD